MSFAAAMQDHRALLSFRSQRARAVSHTGLLYEHVRILDLGSVARALPFVFLPLVSAPELASVFSLSSTEQWPDCGLASLASACDVPPLFFSAPHPVFVFPLFSTEQWPECCLACLASAFDIPPLLVSALHSASGCILSL